jgi:hypothetical protein
MISNNTTTASAHSFDLLMSDFPSADKLTARQPKPIQALINCHNYRPWISTAVVSNGKAKRGM